MVRLEEPEWNFFGVSETWVNSYKKKRYSEIIRKVRIYWEVSEWTVSAWRWTGVEAKVKLSEKGWKYTQEFFLMRKERKGKCELHGKLLIWTSPGVDCRRKGRKLKLYENFESWEIYLLYMKRDLKAGSWTKYDRKSKLYENFEKLRNWLLYMKKKTRTGNWIKHELIFLWQPLKKEK